MLVSRYWYKSIFDRVSPIPKVASQRNLQTHAGCPKLAADTTQLPKRSPPNVCGQKLPLVRLWQLLSVPAPLRPDQRILPSPIYPPYKHTYIACSATVLSVNRPTIMRLRSQGTAAPFRMEASPPWQLRCLGSFFLIKFNWLNIWFTTASKVS